MGNSNPKTMAEEAKEKGESSSNQVPLHTPATQPSSSSMSHPLNTSTEPSSVSPEHQVSLSKPHLLHTSSQPSFPSSTDKSSSSEPHLLHTSSQPSSPSSTDKLSSSKPHLLHTSSQPSSPSSTDTSSSSKPHPLHTSSQPSSSSTTHKSPSSKPHPLHTSSQPRSLTPSHGPPSPNPHPPITEIQPSSISPLEDSNTAKKTHKNAKKTNKTAKIPKDINQGFNLSDASNVTQKSPSPTHKSFPSMPHPFHTSLLPSSPSPSHGLPYFKPHPINLHTFSQPSSPSPSHKPASAVPHPLHTSSQPSSPFPSHGPPSSKPHLPLPAIQHSSPSPLEASTTSKKTHKKANKTKKTAKIPEDITQALKLSDTSNLSDKFSSSTHISSSSMPHPLHTSSLPSSPSPTHKSSSSMQPSFPSPTHKSSFSRQHPLPTSALPSFPFPTHKSSSSMPHPLHSSSLPSSPSPSYGPPSSVPHPPHTSSQPSLPSPSHGLPPYETLPHLTGVQPSSLSPLEASNTAKKTRNNAKKTKKTAKIPKDITQALKLSDASHLTDKFSSLTHISSSSMPHPLHTSSLPSSPSPSHGLPYFEPHPHHTFSQSSSPFPSHEMHFSMAHPRTFSISSSPSPSHGLHLSMPHPLHTSSQPSSPPPSHGPSPSKPLPSLTTIQTSSLSAIETSNAAKKTPKRTKKTVKIPKKIKKTHPLHTSSQPSSVFPSHGPPSSKPIPPLTSVQPPSLSPSEASNTSEKTQKNAKKTKKAAKEKRDANSAGRHPLKHINPVLYVDSLGMAHHGLSTNSTDVHKQSSSQPSDASNMTQKSLKNEVSVFEILKDLKKMLENGIVPPVLQTDLTRLTYKHYFATLLYAEDFYIEKWSEFCLCNVTLELWKSAKPDYKKNLFEIDEDGEKPFVSFEIDSTPERRPFLLLGDFVLLCPSGMKVEPFRGSFFGLVKSKHVSAEFGDDFHLQHSPNRKYDISFFLNRVSLKHCHQAVAAVTEPLFQKFLFPSKKSRGPPPSFIHLHPNLSKEQASSVYTISRLKAPPPYLIEGPLLVREGKLSTTGLVIKEAILEIYVSTPGCRILVNAPVSSTCDALMRSLVGEIPESEMFQANAAFRELDGMPYDLLPSCPIRRESFTCPPLKQLQNFKVISSTYMSSFRLHDEGLSAGHFSHIFMVDASSVTEPETMVSLVNMADEKTVVVANGSIGNHSSWVRSDIARKHGLKMSYFQRLLEREPWCSDDPMFVMHFKD